MTFAEYLRLLRQYWLAVALAAALGAAGALGYSLVSTPLYQAKAQVFVSTQGGSDISALIQGSTFTQQRVKSYTDLVNSPRLLQPVIDTLHLPMTPDALAGEVSANSPPDTVMINIAVTDPSPTRARDIANAIADTFPKLVAELETPPGEAKSPVNVSRTQAADAPTAPVSPKTKLNIVLGLLIGLGLGVGLAVLRDSLDKTLKSKDQAQQTAHAPVMTTVEEDPDAAEHQLITHDAFSPRAEAFRQLRTNIRFLSIDHRVSSVVVTSAVAHEGKSTTAANLAIALAQAGERVVLIDADLRRPTLADVFALSSGVGLTSVLLGDLAVDEALQLWRDDLPLNVLTAGHIPPNPAELIGSARMASLVSELTERGATVVLDSPPLLPVTDAALLARATDGALVVTRAASTHVEQLAAATDALRIAGATVLGVVLNRVPRKRGGSYYGGYSYDSYRSYRSRTPADSSVAPQAALENEPAAAGVAAPPPVQHHPVQLPVPTGLPVMLPAPSDTQAAAPRARTTAAPDHHPSIANLPPGASPAQPAYDVLVTATAPQPPAQPDPNLRIVLPPSQLPEIVRHAIDVTAPDRDGVPHRDENTATRRPRPGSRRAARAGGDPDLVIDPERGTYTQYNPGTRDELAAAETAWPAEWGDLPALVHTPRNGHTPPAAGARHRN